MKEKPALIGFYNPSVILTYIGLASAVSGMFASIEGRSTLAVTCLLFSGLCDAFDGKIARMIKRTEDEKRFGIQIDSLCDLVCFGALPAVIAWNLGVKGTCGAILLALYVLAGVIRLGYFNVTEEQRQQQTSEVRHWYQGVPITTVALLLPGIYAIFKFVPSLITPAVGVCMLFLTAAFVLNIRIPKLSGKRLYIILGSSICLIAVLLSLGG